MDLTSQELLALLPIATAATLASRLVLGWRTIGTFAPALLALTVMQLGTRDAGAALLVAGGATLLVSRSSIVSPSRGRRGCRSTWSP